MLSPEKVLDHYFLEARCMLIELAATLDRYDRAVERAGGASGSSDPRVDRLFRSLELLAARDGGPDRAERLLELFSGRS